MGLHEVKTWKYICDSCKETYTLTTHGEKPKLPRGWFEDYQVCLCGNCVKETSPLVGVKGQCPHPDSKVIETAYNYHKNEGSYKCTACGHEW